MFTSYVPTSYLSQHINSATTLLYNGFYKTDESFFNTFVIKQCIFCVTMSCMIFNTV